MLRSGFCDEASRIAAGRCFAKPAQHDKFLSSVFPWHRPPGLVCEAIPNSQLEIARTLFVRFVANTAPPLDYNTGDRSRTEQVYPLLQASA